MRSVSHLKTRSQEVSRLSLAPFTQHCGFPPHIKSILYGFLSKLGELEGFKPFQLRTVREKETNTSVFVSMCGIFRVQLLS